MGPADIGLVLSFIYHSVVIISIPGTYAIYSRSQQAVFFSEATLFMHPKTDHEGHYAPELIISKLCLELPSVSLTVRELSGGTAHNIDIKAD